VKICYFNDYRLGVIKGDTVVDVTDAVKDIPHLDARDLIVGLIAKWDAYKDKVAKAAQAGTGVPLKGVKLRPPVPRPGNIVCMAVNYMEDGTLKEREHFLRLKDDHVALHLESVAPALFHAGRGRHPSRQMRSLFHFGWVHFREVVRARSERMPR
jgi:hypothetical protein